MKAIASCDIARSPATATVVGFTRLQQGNLLTQCQRIGSSEDMKHATKPLKSVLGEAQSLFTRSYCCPDDAILGQVRL